MYTCCVLCSFITTRKLTSPELGEVPLSDQGRVG